MIPPVFHESALKDPLFAAEGADIEACRQALAAIEQRTRTLEKVLSGRKSSGTRYWLYRTFFFFFPLRSYAFPLPFVRAVLESEENRRTYLAHPSVQTARSLVGSWRIAAMRYARCVRRYRRLHTVALWLEPLARNYVIQDLFGNTSTVPHIERVLRRMQRNGVRLMQEVDERTRLLSGAIVSRTTSSLVDAPAVALGTLRAEFALLHELEKKHGIMPFRHTSIESTYGPFNHTLSHFDGTPTPHTFMLYMLSDKKTGLKSMWVAVLDRFLFTKVWDPNETALGTGRKTPFVFSGGLTADDTPYWYEPAGHLYVLRDPSYWMDIATHVDLGHRTDAQEDLVRVQKSSLLHLMLGACADDLRTFVRHTERRARNGTLGSYSLLYGLLMRTHPALYYLSFNKSVWRLHESPEFLGERWNTSSSSPYEPESQVLSKVSREDLVRMMSAQALREERERASGWPVS